MSFRRTVLDRYHQRWRSHHCAIVIPLMVLGIGLPAEHLIEADLIFVHLCNRPAQTSPLLTQICNLLELVFRDLSFAWFLVCCDTAYAAQRSFNFPRRGCSASSSLLSSASALRSRFRYWSSPSPPLSRSSSTLLLINSHLVETLRVAILITSLLSDPRVFVICHKSQQSQGWGSWGSP